MHKWKAYRYGHRRYR